MDIELSVIDYESPLYVDVLNLRQDILRRPIGLNLFDEDLSEDRDQYIIVAVHEQQVVACLMLKILDKDSVKLRQMAVVKPLQGKGIGATVVNYAENFCVLNEYSMIELHARQEAMRFYEKLGYSIDGEAFEEVGIPHFRLTKTLQ